jgi:hypothetical protein
MNKGLCVQIFILIGLLLLSSVQILLEDVVAYEGDPVMNPDERLYVSGYYQVSGFEMWRDVYVNRGARLVVTNGGHLVAGMILLNSDSTFEVSAGKVTLSNRTHTDQVGIYGTCDRFIVTRRSVVTIDGADGVYDIPSSMGSRAGIDLLVSQNIKIDHSTIDIRAGDGMSPPEPLTTDDVGDDSFAGGHALLSLELTGTQTPVWIKDVHINVRGGAGGDAPDGRPSESLGIGGIGGGFTRGGDVSGTVARGGDAKMVLVGTEFEVSAAHFTLSGGAGGAAGDAGDAGTDDLAGAGGGGYSGGDGAFEGPDTNPAIPGGDVSGETGRGGDAIVIMQGISSDISGSSMTVEAGYGGRAGQGGASEGDQGGGGGGYSGGGGGAAGWTPGADGGDVGVSVGSGGYAYVNISMPTLLDIRNTGIYSDGGRGGDAGAGGNTSSLGGGGGGGYAGGGGGASGGTNGGDGGVLRYDVGKGGDATLDLSSVSVIAINSALRSHGGDGGAQGLSGTYVDEASEGTAGGPGAGGCSAGGGAGLGVGTSPDGEPGSPGMLHGVLGNGGDAAVRVMSELATIGSSTGLSAMRGLPGQMAPVEEYDPLRGGRSILVTAPGSTDLHIPMSRPMLLEPVHQSSIYLTPEFEWVDVHDSTTNGKVVGYVLITDTDPLFKTPDRAAEVQTNTVTVLGLQFGVHYWKVLTLYEKPEGSTSPLSPIAWFNFFNAPPRFQILEPIGVRERVLTPVNLAWHITDECAVHREPYHRRAVRRARGAGDGAVLDLGRLLQEVVQPAPDHHRRQRPARDSLHRRKASARGDRCEGGPGGVDRFRGRGHRGGAVEVHTVHTLAGHAPVLQRLHPDPGPPRYDRRAERQAHGGGRASRRLQRQDDHKGAQRARPSRHDRGVRAQGRFVAQGAGSHHLHGEGERP